MRHQTAANSNAYFKASTLLWRQMRDEDQIRWIGSRLREMATTEVATALRMLPDGQLKEICAHLNQLIDEVTDE